MRILILLFCLSLSDVMFPQSIKFPPPDEIYKDSSLVNFLATLKHIISTKDKQALLGVIDSNIKYSFGNEIGFSDFQKIWKLDESNSPLWSTLDRLLSMGGCYTDYHNSKDVCFPYYFGQKLPDNVDITFASFIVGERVNIRREPTEVSGIIGTFSNELVLYDAENRVRIPACTTKTHSHYTGEFDAHDWNPIKTLDGKTKGFVYWSNLYWSMDYRLFLSKESGKWKIICLVNGD